MDNVIEIKNQKLWSDLAKLRGSMSWYQRQQNKKSFEAALAIESKTYKKFLNKVTQQEVA